MNVAPQRTYATPEGVLRGYFDAHKLVLEAGYISDLVWADGLAAKGKWLRADPKEPARIHYVASEHAWVVFNSGFRYAVMRKLWPRLEAAFQDFPFNPSGDDRRKMRADALNVIRNDRKVDAVLAMQKLIVAEGIEEILSDADDPPELMRLPFIGKITCYHFAKVLGADVVKPDVHLQRAARAAHFDSADAMVTSISSDTGDRKTVIDSVLWRYGEQQRARGWADWDVLFRKGVE